MSFPEKRVTFLILIIALGTALRFYGLGWELPEVYEEATPLIKAWEMWNWGTGRPVDLNPHFFNYPGLTIYIHFLIQGALFVSMKILGLVSSAAEFYAIYIADKTVFYYTGRIINAIFGIATIYAVYLAAKRLAGGWKPGILAAVLLSANTFHISKSQLIEVDIPLTFFVVIALLGMSSLLRTGSFRNRLMTGVFTGLAVSTKYTAAILVVPLVVTVWMASKRADLKTADGTSGYSRLLSFSLQISMIMIVAIAAFLLTSPYTVLDWNAFRGAVSFEQHHMEAGHFGMENIATLPFYAGSVSRILPGWPLFLLSALSVLYLAFYKRERVSIIFASFLIPYALVVSSWSMKADRYLLPLLPLLLIFSSAGISKAFGYILSGRFTKIIRYSSVAILSVAAAAPLAASYPGHFHRLGPDNRTVAKRWIEENVPPGSFVVSEMLGPDLMRPQVIAGLPSDIRDLINDRYGNIVRYAVLHLPMFQTLPERSEAFYDLSLYRMADIIITSSSVSSRYLDDPKRFGRQIGFYRQLASEYTVIFRTGPEDGNGPSLTIFRNPHHDLPVSDRSEVSFPSLLGVSAGRRPTGSEELFYLDLGLNYQTFDFHRQAIASFQLAFKFPVIRITSYNSLILGMTRSYLALDQPEKAVGLLEEAGRNAPSGNSREIFKRIGQKIRRDSGI